MIKDTLKNSKIYHNLSDKIAQGLHFLENNDMKKMKNGKYEISGEDLFVTVQEYTSKQIEDCRFESHKKYIDIQYIIEGKEQILVANRDNFINDSEYNDEKDIEFLIAKNNNVLKESMKMQEKDFLILYPQDVHMPMVKLETPTLVKKAVIKVRI